MNDKLKLIVDGKSILSGNLSGPYCVEIDPTDHCLLECRYCFWKGMRKNKTYLSEDSFQRLINDLIKIRVRGIIFTGGGEPLDHPYTPIAINKARDGGIHIGLFTNGVLLSRETASTILPNLSWIRFGLSAPDRESYKLIHGVDFYGLVIDNIQNCVSYKKDKKLPLRIGIGCILNPTFFDIKMLQSLLSLAEKIGLDFIQFKHDLLEIQDTHYERWWKSSVIPEIKVQSRVYNKITIEYSESTYLNRKAAPCFIAKEMAVIKSDGSVCLCKLHRDTPSMVIGNIYNRPFADVWEGNEKNKIIKRLEKNGCNICCNYRDINQYIKGHEKVNNQRISACNIINHNEKLIEYGENIFFI